MNHVIIGAGPAGVVAAETLRKLDPDSTITLIGDEPEPPYSRMAIPYLLVENINEAGTYLRRDNQHYSAANIKILRERVDKVDSNARQLTLQSGATVAYDRLLVCTGSMPIRPPIPGMDLDGVHNCWTLEDARHIAQLAKPEAKVILIGAGFIGCIILEALASRGVDLSVIEMGDRMVPRMMDATAGGLIKSWCESKGVNVHTATKVEKVEAAQTTSTNTHSSTNSSSGGGLKKLFSALTGGSKPVESAKDSDKQSGHRFKVTLSNGQVLDADLVISAAGVKPNTKLLDGSGVEIDNGILVNHYLQTNIPEIYAAGDVARGRDFSTGAFEVHAIQPTATEHGRIAAQNMAGIETHYEGSFNMNVLDTLGLISSSFGLWMGVEGGASAELVDTNNYRYLNLQFQDDLLIGATSLGLTQHVGVLRGLIQGKVHLGPWKAKLMDDPTRVMDAYLAMNYTAQHAA